MHQPGGAVRLVRGDHPQAAPALTALAWALGLGVTAMILGTPYLVFGYHNPALHLVLETADGCIAFLVSYLVLGRYLRGRRLRDLLLSQALFLLGLAGLGLSLLLPMVLDLPARTVGAWLPLTARVSAAVLLLTAALAGDRPAPTVARARVLVAPWLFAAGLVIGCWALRDAMPVAIDASAPASAQRPVIDGHPALLAGQAVGAFCFLAASVLFALQARRGRDELLLWLGPACALGGFARVSYVLFPSLYSDWIYTGDLLRTGCYLLLLVGAAREISRYWTAQARAAVLEDRRRLARELHDGVAQELGYIRAEAHHISSPELRASVVGSVDRAMDEARAAVDALGRSPDEPLAFVIHRAAQQVAERYGARVVVDLDDSVEADQTQRHALVRITREAVSNAIRHGRADCVRVTLARDSGGRRLVVQDDGAGFEVERTVGGSGYGMTSMRERAQALPGALDLRSAVGAGTTVEVSW